MPTSTYVQRVDAWDERAGALLSQLAPQFTLAAEVASSELSESDVSEQVNRYIDDAAGIIEQSAGEDDLDQHDVAAAVTRHAAEVVAALVAAGSDPDEAAEFVALDAARARGDARAIQEECVAAIRGLPMVAGAAAPTSPPTVEGELDQLAKTVGQELVALGSDTLIVVAPALLQQGLDAVLGGSVKAAFDSAVHALHGVVNWLKRQATHLVGAITGWLNGLIGPGLASTLFQAFDKIRDKLSSSAGEWVGGAAADLFGRDEAVRRASQLNAGQAAAAIDKIDHRDKNVDWLAGARKKIDDSWVSKVVKGVAAAQPAVQIAYVVFIAVVIGWVLVQLWDGIHAV